jgi:hypothetical protein
MIDMQVVAAFCSQKAWSIKISPILFSAMFTQRGSVGSLSPNMLAKIHMPSPRPETKKPA